MRLLLTTDTVGGVWTFTQQLTESLLSAGDSVALVSFGRAASASQRAWAADVQAHHGLSFFYRESIAPLEWMDNNERAFTDGGAALTKTAAEFCPDLLHANQFCWGALPLQIPVVLTSHSDVMSWAEACRPEVLNGSAWLTRYCALVQSGLDGADAVTAPTAWARDALRSHFRVRCGFEVIANGRSVPRADGHPERKLRAVTAGRLWDPGKGLAILSQISSPLPVHVAGDDTFENASHGLTQVLAKGALTQEALFRLFRESAIYIAGSIYEPFGLAPLEAAQCGCAIVARDLPSLREVWGEAAMYFENADQLEKALQALASDSRLLRQVQEACERRAAYFSAARMVSGYRSLYTGLLSTSRRAPAEGSASHAA